MRAPSIAFTVLVVEDEPLIRMFVAASLEEEGFQVFEARDGAAALEVLEKVGPIDIVVTDVQMPGPMDGIALVKRVRRDWPSIPSIVMSGNAEARQVMEAGAAHFIRKPCLPREIVAAIRRVLEIDRTAYGI